MALYRAVIDRIEDKKHAVLHIFRGKKFVEAVFPVDFFGFGIHEGMHLIIEIRQDPDSELKLKEKIIKLQKKLRKKWQ